MLNNDKTALSCSSGTAFPTTGLIGGMLCFRTDQLRLYILKDMAPTWSLLADLNGGNSAVSELANGATVRAATGANGGQIVLAKGSTGTSLVGNLAIELNGDSLRIFDAGTGNGFSFNVAAGAANAATKIWNESNDGAGSGLDADLLDGKQSGNAKDNIPINNGTVNVNLNADLLDGIHAGNKTGQIPISNGVVNKDLNAELLDGLRHTAFVKKVNSTAPDKDGNVAISALADNVTCPTAPPGANDNRIATTAFVQAATSTKPRSVLFTASGAFTAPTERVFISGCGGGGGGGNGATTNAGIVTGAPGCGGGAAEARLRIPVGTTPGFTYTITIGAGGAAQTNGGNTSFGGLLTLRGGGGGQNGTSVGSSPIGARGGAACGAGGGNGGMPGSGGYQTLGDGGGLMYVGTAGGGGGGIPIFLFTNKNGENGTAGAAGAGGVAANGGGGGGGGGIGAAGGKGGNGGTGSGGGGGGGAGRNYAAGAGGSGGDGALFIEW
ncbi:MAG: hypothetical protein FWF12_00540 [Betaproteobacteria bacterium]|nr:hypothetical protein [Betaproteobacteria bacterium]